MSLAQAFLVVAGSRGCGCVAPRQPEQFSLLVDSQHHGPHWRPWRTRAAGAGSAKTAPACPLPASRARSVEQPISPFLAPHSFSCFRSTLPFNCPF